MSVSDWRSSVTFVMVVMLLDDRRRGALEQGLPDRSRSGHQDDPTQRSNPAMLAFMACMIGLTDAVDSLAALKVLVYEQPARLRR